MSRTLNVAYETEHKLSKVSKLKMSIFLAIKN